MATHNDLSWWKGEDILLSFTMAPTTDITGWTISLAVKPSLDAAASILTVAGSILSAAAGTYSISITAAQNTTTLSSGSYVYAVTRTDSGSVAVLSEGAILIKPSAKLA